MNVNSGGAIDSFRGEYAFLSNFAATPFIWKGVLWPTSEHAFQAAKAHFPHDAEAIRMAPTPAAAKALGRQVTMRPNWDAGFAGLEPVRIQVMREILFAKFDQDRSWTPRLMATAPKVLVEGNTWGDRFWGQVNGVGENWLGRLLMEVRQRRLEEDDTPLIE